MKETNPGPTEASIKLDKLLEEETPEAEAIRGRFHRTMLWRLRTHRRSPDLDTAVEIRRLSGGLITEEGWTRPAGAPASGSGEHAAIELPKSGTDGT